MPEIAPSRLPTAALERARHDPAYRYHLAMCANDPDMMELLLGRESRLEVSQVGAALSAGKAFVRWLGGGARTLPDEEFKARLNACDGCPNSGRPGELTDGGRLQRLFGASRVCRLCGCDVVRKARLPDETCPDADAGPTGRWPAMRDA